MEAGDLRVPEIPLAPGEDDLDSNKNSQQYVFHFALHNTLLSPPSTPPEYGQNVCQRLPRNPNELIQSLYYALPSAHYHPKSEDEVNHSSAGEEPRMHEDLSSSLEDLVGNFDERINSCLKNPDVNTEDIAPVQIRTQDEVMAESQSQIGITFVRPERDKIEYSSQA
ncbi:unnamed protein product [Heligmosomoides polygyrus]|uniref:NAC domain-containing protein n=1 Tax=Heligmosomoides polygyrus TaxID=6339 RepID=A0A3P8CH15_HELPZ|nr:unnamed protein product [Heligmosomoides polygyrus]